MNPRGDSDKSINQLIDELRGLRAELEKIQSATEAANAGAALSEVANKPSPDADARQDHERYRLAAEAVNALIYDWDVQTNTIQRIRGLPELMGYQLAETRPEAEWWYEQIHPEDQSRLRAALSQAMAQPAAFSVEYRLRGKDGSYRHVLDKGTILRDPNGKAQRVVGSILDISDYKTSEQTLREEAEKQQRGFEDRIRSVSEANERQLHTLVHGLDAILWEADPSDLRFTFVSQGAERVLGYPHDQWLKEPDFWIKIIHPDDRERVTTLCRTAIEAGADQDFECRAVDAGNRVVWLQNVVYVVRDDDGRARGLRGLMLNITKRVRAEEAVREGEARTRAMLETAIDGIITIDQSSAVNEWNPSAERIFGYSRKEAMGRDLTELIIPPSLREQHREGMKHYLASGVERVLGRPVEMPALRADGSEFLVELAINRIATGGPPMFTAYVRDITQRRRALEILRQSEERFRIAAESASDLIYEWDINSGRLEWFGDIDRRLGYLSHEFPRTLEAWEKIVHPDDFGRVSQAIEHTLKMREPFFEEYRVFQKDGTIRYWTDRGTALWNEQGEPYKWYGATVDITERKLAERRVAAHHAVTQVLANASLEEAPARIVQAICEHLSWDLGALWHVDREANVLRRGPSWHSPSLDFPEFEAASQRTTFISGIGLPGRVWASGVPVWIFDVTEDTNFPRSSFAAKEGLHGGFGFPIRVSGEVIGVIELFSQQVRQQDEELLKTLDALGNQIGLFMERRRAEEQLRRSQQELTDFIENASVGLHWVGPDGQILWANRAELELLGYDRDEYVGHHISEFHVDRAAIDDILGRLARSEALNNYEARLRCKDGSIKQVLIDANAFWDKGEFKHTRWFTRDLTERKRAEEALRASEERLRAIFTQAIVGIAQTDFSGRFVLVNQRFCDLVGRSREDVLGLRMQDLTHPEDLPRNLALFERLAADGSPFVIEKRYVRPDGTHVWVNNSASVVAGQDGKPQYAVAIVQDITDRKRAEESSRFLVEVGAILAESLNYRETLASVARLAVPRFADWCLIDVIEADGQLHRLEAVHWDPAKLELLSELASRFPPDLADPRGVPNVLRTGKAELYSDIPDVLLKGEARNEDHLKQLRALEMTSAMVVPLSARGHIFGAVTFITGESGRRYQETDLAMAEELARRAGLAVDNARLYRAAQQEIAERKRAEEIIQRLNQNLEWRVAERTAELKEINDQMEAFCYSVSHDLRAPLRAMQGFSHALVEDYVGQLDETGRDYAQRIVKSAEHMDNLIQDLLTYSRLGRLDLKFAPVELDLVLNRTLASLAEGQSRANAEIEVKRPLPAVIGHATTLEQVLSNLVSNALKFVAEGVRPRVCIWAEEKEATVRLWVEDNGIGVGPEHQDKIFRVFERLHGVDVYPGTGIGLAIVRKGVERMGGRAGVVSNIGQGSRFWIELPRPHPE